MHSPYLTTRLSYLKTACWEFCWSLQTRKDHRCGREFVLLAKLATRCCETNWAMSHLLIAQVGKTEYWLVYASTRARSSLARRKYGFRIWTLKDYQKHDSIFVVVDCFQRWPTSYHATRFLMLSKLLRSILTG